MNVDAGLALIREFEGLELAAYPDPLSGGEPWTIGYGSTKMPDGRPVRRNDRITEGQAEAMLRATVNKEVLPALAKIPGWDGMSDGQRGALVSFAWNLGWHFYGTEGFSTLSQRLKGKEWSRVPDALMLYVNPGTPVETGLRRRRTAEGKLWAQGLKPVAAPPEADISMVAAARNFKNEPHQVTAYEWLHNALTIDQRKEFARLYRARPVAPAPSFTNPLTVPYFSQRDNASGQGHRECFSSACAMLAAFYGKVESDDQYNAIRRKYGDTTNSSAQVKALQELGLVATFRQNLTLTDVTKEIQAGRPLAVGWLHYGNYRAPAGSGHWTTIVGLSNGGTVHHDPYGLCDLVHGGYKSAQGGQYAVFPNQYWERRWMPKGNDGWAVLVKEA